MRETTLKIQFTNGNLLTGETTATTVSAKVLKGETDITAEYAASAFVWTRDTGNAAADATWNAAHNGVKQFTMNAADLTENVKLTCTLTGTSPDYGTVYVDEHMNLIHAPAEADANDTLHLENGILSVETEGNEYRLNGNVLGVIRHRLNGSVTAEAWVYTAAPEKLVEFKYDSNGLRTQKKVTDHGQVVVTEYIYHGQKLVGLTCGNDTLHFFYDAQNRPAKVEYHGKMYLYVCDVQGDIIGLIDDAGELVSEYRYDTWGKSVGAENIFSSSILQRNPFGYRGYIYDEETDLYYLKNRFYVVNASRFLNADDILGLARMMEENLFSYCLNSPIMCVDLEGHKPQSFESLTYQEAEARFQQTLFKKILNTFRRNAEEARKTAVEKFGMNAVGQYNEPQNFIEILFWVKEQFKEGGSFDFKAHGLGKLSPKTVLKAGEKTYTMEDLGNIHYGFVGSSIGLSKEVLYAGSLYNHRMKHGDWNEDPHDYEMISLGIELAEIYYPDMVIFE